MQDVRSPESEVTKITRDRVEALVREELTIKEIAGRLNLSTQYEVVCVLGRFWPELRHGSYFVNLGAVRVALGMRRLPHSYHNFLRNRHLLRNAQPARVQDCPHCGGKLRIKAVGPEKRRDIVAAEVGKEKAAQGV